MNLLKMLKWVLLDQFTLYGGGGKGGGGGGGPSYPDPNVVANATTQTNEQTAAYNKALNLNNYSNPFGSQQSQQIGTDPNTGAPIYNTSVTANPQLQSALNSLLGEAGQSGAINAQAQSGINGLFGNFGNLNQSLGGLGSQYSALSPQYSALSQGLGSLAGQLNQGQAAAAQQQGQNAAYAAQTQYLDPQFSQQKESLDASLANSGLTPGSEAYNNAMTNYNNTKQQAYSNAQNQAIMTGSQIGAQNLQNQIAGINTQAGLYGQQAGLLGNQAGLLGAQAGLYGQMGSNLGQQGSLLGQSVGIGQVPYSNLQSIASMIPGYSGTGQSGASPADIAGLYNNQYQSQLANYNAGQASSNNTMSGLFGLGSAGLLAYGLSDRRAKRNIRRVGTFPNGLPVYSYRYAWEPENVVHIGFMADEVRKVAPHAVLRGADGFDRVCYRMAA
jgi:hypothetical protein